MKVLMWAIACMISFLLGVATIGSGWFPIFMGIAAGCGIIAMFRLARRM